MADRILVDVQVISDAKSTYQSSKDAELSAIQIIDQTIHGLESVWEGSAASAYYTAFNELFRNIMSSQNVMQDAITELQKVIDNTAQTEGTDLTSAANNLDNGQYFEI